MEGLSIASERQQPEARYAYYRRCQHFRKNGQQCKAPAVKPMCCGDREFRQGTFCWAHAGQLSVERKRQVQRLELLTRPGLGYGDPKTIQRTLGAACQALVDNQIDEKTAGRLAWEIQTVLTMFLKKPKFGFLNHRGYGGTRRKRRNRKRNLHHGGAETRRGIRRRMKAKIAKPKVTNSYRGFARMNADGEVRRYAPDLDRCHPSLRKIGAIRGPRCSAPGSARRSP